MSKLLAYLVVGSLSLIPMTAAAENQGAVKVECWGRCDLVTLGQICDTYAQDSEPVALACDDTADGSGWTASCGSATCKPYGSLVRFDKLSDYCAEGAGYDAVVTCRTEGAVAAGEVDEPKLAPTLSR